MKMRALIALSALFVLSGCSLDAPQATSVRQLQPVAPIEQRAVENEPIETKQTEVEQVKIEGKQDSVVEQVEPAVEKATSVPAVVTEQPKAVEQAPVVVEQLKVEQVPVVEKVKETAVPLSNDNTYTNTDGIEVHSPAFAPSIPAGASARCRDGTYSFSLNRRGTCSGHGGVEEWL